MLVVDQIRKLLDQPDGLTVESLTPLAEEYSRTTTAANVRLGECIQLLRKGLRAEAIQRAGIKPKLIDLSAELDFPELQEWFDILKFYGINVPTLLDQDAAQQLQEAVVDEQPIEDLLKQHRRLAIAKAPLQWRIKVLKRMAFLDSKTPVWREDQAQWEVIRLKQIPSELGKAIESKSLQLVTELATELGDPNWIVKPAPELIKRATDTLEGFKYADQLKQLHAIADSIHDGYSQGDSSKVQASYKEWTSIVNSMSIKPPDDLIESVEPAIEWLNERLAERSTFERYEQACATLEDMLQDKKSTIAELQQRYFDVVSTQQMIPPLLEQRYVTKLTQMQQAARRRTQFFYFAVTTGSLCLLTLFALWQWYSNKIDSIAKTEQRLKQLVAAEEYSTAEETLKRLREEAPAIANSAGIVAIAADLKTKIEEESDRIERVQQLIADADEDDPSLIDRVKLEVAEKAVKTDSEKQDIETVRRAYDKHQISLIDKEYQSTMLQIGQLESQLQQIQIKKQSEISDSELEALINNVQSLRTQFPKGAPRAEQSIDLFKKKVVAFRLAHQKNLGEIAKRQKAMSGLRNAKSPETFEREMEDYVSSLPGDSLAQEFTDTLKEKELWRAVEAWNKCCKELEESENAGFTTQKYASLISTLATIEKKYSSEKSTQAKNLAAELRLLSDAMEKRSEALAELTSFFETDTIFRDFGTIIIPTGKDGIISRERVFVPTEVKNSNSQKIKSMAETSSVTLDVVVNQNGGTKSTKLSGRLTENDEPRACTLEIARYLKSNKNTIIEEWDTYFFKILSKITEQPDLDRDIKKIFLYEVAKTFRSGSVPLQFGFKDFDLISVPNWFEQKKLVSQMTKEDRTVMEIIERKKRWGEREMKKRELFAPFRGARIDWVGAILRNHDNQISGLFQSELKPSTKLVTVVPMKDRPNSAIEVEIGKVSSSRVVEFNSSSEFAIPGRPIYAISTDAPRSKQNR